jgi:hypothetical protein
MLKYVSTLLVASLFFCLPVRAEEFLLKDGTKITGTLTGVLGDSLQIKTAYGDISVPRAQIISITFTENQPKPSEPAASSGAVRPVVESLHDGKYINQSGGFAVTLPAEWKLAPDVLASAPSLIAALTSADETRFLLVTPEKFAGTTDTYRVLVETQIKTNFTDYQELEQNDVTIDGRKALRMVCTGSKKDSGTQVKFLVFIIPYEGRMMRLTFGSLVPFFNDALPVFEKIAGSYQALPK